MEQAKGILLLGINAKYIHTNLALYSLRQYAIKAAGMYGDYYRENIFLREYTINHRTEEIILLYLEYPDGKRTGGRLYEA